MSHSEIEVPPEGAAALEAAFRARAKKVDAHEGFLGLELLRDVGRPGRYVLQVRWASREHFRRNMKSDDFRRTPDAWRDLGVVTCLTIGEARALVAADPATLDTAPDLD